MSWSYGTTGGRVEAVRDEVLIQARIMSIRRSYPGSSESKSCKMPAFCMEYIVSVYGLYDAAYNCTTPYPDASGHLPLSSHTIDATQGNPSIVARDIDHHPIIRCFGFRPLTNHSHPFSKLSLSNTLCALCTLCTL